MDGNPGQILNQLIGALIGIAFAIVGTFLALKIAGLVTRLRMNPGEQASGMDLTLHGEEGYNLEA